MLISLHRARIVKVHASPHLLALTEGINIPLDKPIVLIGRHQECDIQIPSRKISRRHCCIAQVADHLVIRDLGSTNGIRINGVKVVEGNLNANDELTIGNMRYQVKWGAGSHHTLPASAKNGIKLDQPRLIKRPTSDESFDEPMPLPDQAQAFPVLQGQSPIANMEIPDNIDLKPLESSGQ